MINWKGLFKKKHDKATPKELATMRGDPWVGIVNMNVNYDNLVEGMFELDWNDIFIARLVKKGYRGKDDRAIVEQWFETICAGVADEEFQEFAAQYPGNGKRHR